MNTRLLRKVQKQILKEPRQFQMRHLYEMHLSGIKIPNCGTAACIAGWSGIVGANYAAGKIGVEYSEENLLFFFNNWPDQFRNHTKEGTSAFAKQAARRIDHFIKTNGAE